MNTETTKDATELPHSIFELTDNTDDETYYCLGLYYALEEAIEEATHGDAPCTDCEDHAVLEIRERSVGFSGWGNNGKTRATVTWKRSYDGDGDDEGKWTFVTEMAQSDVKAP